MREQSTGWRSIPGACPLLALFWLPFWSLLQTPTHSAPNPSAVGFDAAAGKVRIYGNGNQPMHYIALDDVAKVVAGAVGNQRVARKTLRFGGAFHGVEPLLVNFPW